MYFIPQSQIEKAACLLHDPTSASIVHYNCLKNNSTITKIREVRINRLQIGCTGEKNNCHRYLLDWSQVNGGKLEDKGVQTVLHPMFSSAIHQF